MILPYQTHVGILGTGFALRLLGSSYQANNNPSVGGVDRGGFRSRRNRSFHGLCSTSSLLLLNLHTLLTLGAVWHQFLFLVPIRHLSKVLANLQLLWSYF